MKRKILDFPLQHARLVFVGLAVLTIGLGSAIPWIQVDTDPENMLSERDPARVFHNQTKEEFALHDLIVVGVVNEVEPAGVFNPESLARVHELNERLKSIDGVIARDVLGPSTMDNIEQAGPGAIRFEWLMEQPPKTPEEALAIKEAALRLPMLRGTVVSEDGKSIALYVPIESKDQSHRISEEIRTTIAGFGDNTDDFYITGLPVAEDTFGVEMFKQMAVSAPLAALVILLLMWWFFRSFALVLSPMIVALTTVTITMGALIASGFTVHIMSSMIPIFLMPIAVVDSVHLLSEFVDSYAKQRDRKAAIKEVVGHLFAPMLYTSLTSAAGFLSLTFTPIPPVRVFGVFVALGIGIAFVLTILFVPAYIAVLPEKRLAALLSSKRDKKDGGLLGRAVAAVGDKSLRFAKPILVVTVAAIAISAYGITKININDNPVRWFKPSHEIRVADAVLNRELAGTYTAYLIMKQDTDAERQIVEAGDAAVQGASDGVRAKWAELKTESETASREGVTNVSDALVEATSDLVFDTAGEESEQWQSVQTALEKAQSASKTFQNPEHLAYIERLQRAAEALPLVGKTSSIADVVKTVYRELISGEDKDYRIPESNEGVAQTLLQFQSSHRPNDLWHLVSPDYRESAIWMQLKSGDNQDMMSVKAELDAFLSANPPPDGLRAQWAGLTYLNVVWQDEMVGGMLESLMGAFVIVFLMMVILFRSPVYGVLAMIPLTITILFTYGMIGLVGKDYDMPVAVLSSLTLGLSVDFAIHFLERARSIQAVTGDWKETMALMFQEPGRAITRNAIVIAIGFLPLLAAPLVPYNTVGFLMAAIMAVSSIVTVLLLPSLMMQIQNWLSPRKEKVSTNAEDASASLATNKEQTI
ncbi:MAG TPA: MMPL family transporter [Polyangiales bacterium]|nr:MMPL family transporter [Polyangiales bacterium]